MRLLAFNHQRHLRGPKASTFFSGPGFNAAMTAAGMLALHANVVHDRAPNNHLATTFSFIAGSLGYAILSPVVNDFVGGYAISASESRRGKSGSSSGLVNPPGPSKAVPLRDAASGHGGVDPSFIVATYASSANTGRSALSEGFHGGGPSRDLSSTGVQGDSTSRNSRNNNEGSNRDRPTPPDEDRPRRSSRLANGKKHANGNPRLSTKQSRAGGGGPPPPPPGAGTTPGIEGSKASTFSLGSLLLAGLVLSVLIRAINSRKGKNLKKKKRLMVCERILGLNPMCAPLDISNTTSTALDIVDPRLSKPTCEIIHAICGLVTKAYHSNIKLASWRLPSQLGDVVRALVSALNYRLSATEIHFSGDSMITETCEGTYCGGLTLNMSMQHAMESFGRAGSAIYDGGLRQTSRYLRRVLLYVSVVILTMFARQLLCIILPYIDDGVSYVEQPVSDIPRPRLLIGSATQVATPVRHTPHNIRKKIPLPVGSGWVTVEARNHSPSDDQNVPSVDSTEIKVDVIPESQLVIEVLEQIIPEPTAVAEPKNAVKLDNPIAPVLAESPLEEDAEIFICPSLAMEFSQPDNSELFIHPSFVADVDVQHEQVDSNNFVFQGDSNANDNDKDESGLVVDPRVIDDSLESVFNDLFGEVKDVKAYPEPYVPERDLRTSIHAPQNLNSSCRVGDTDQSSVADKGKPYIAYVPERDLGTSIHAPQTLSSSDRVGNTGQSSIADKGKPCIAYVSERDLGTSIYAPQNLSSSDRVGDTGQCSVADKGKKKANLDVEVEDQTNDVQKEDIVAVEENATAIDSTLPVFVALPGYRRHRIRPKQRRRAWLASQAAAKAAETIN